MSQIIQKISAVQRQRVSVTEGLAELDSVISCCIVCEILGIATALADKRYGTAFFGCRRPGQKPRFRHIKSHAIRTDNPQATFQSNLFHLLLQPDACLLPRFLKTRSENMDGLV